MWLQVQKVVDKLGADVVSVCHDTPVVELLEDIEKTQHGWIALPDTTAHGPIFFCILEMSRNSKLGNEHRQSQYSET